MRSISRFTRTALAVATLCTIAACGKEDAQAPAQSAPPPMPVPVVTVTQQPLAVMNELPGRIEAIRVAEVRARVPGIVLKRSFREGTDVQAGAVLFQIDPAPYQAAVNSAQAALAKAEVNLKQTSLKAERYTPLVEINAISQQEYEDVVTAKKQAEADVAAAKAAVETASLNLGYATVTSPIAGRVGRAMVTEGALVGQGTATELATVQQLNRVYVNITQSSSDYLKLKEAMSRGQLKNVGNGSASVRLVMEDGSLYQHAGKLLFSDLTVDQSTNTILLRAEFPNPDRALLPGMYVRTQLEQAMNEHAIVVPQQAVAQGANGPSVMLVGPDNTVTPRPVKTGGSYQQQWIITEGLAEGDKVIVEGFQKIRPGAPVTAVAWKKEAGADTAAAAGTPAPAK